jgi:hypothetical protein
VVANGKPGGGCIVLDNDDVVAPLPLSLLLLSPSAPIRLINPFTLSLSLLPLPLPSLLLSLSSSNDGTSNVVIAVFDDDEAIVLVLAVAIVPVTVTAATVTGEWPRVERKSVGTGGFTAVLTCDSVTVNADVDDTDAVVVAVADCEVDRSGFNNGLVDTG